MLDGFNIVNDQLLLGLTSFLVSEDIPVCSIILSFKCLTHSESLESPY